MPATGEVNIVVSQTNGFPTNVPGRTTGCRQRAIQGS